MIRFLLADDEPHIRNWIEHKADFEAAGITECNAFDDGDTALAAFQEQSFDILLTDVRMPRMDGPTLAEKARELNPDVVILFLSAYSDKEYYRTALQLHAATFIEKPIDLEELNQAILEAAQEVRRRRREIQNETFTALVRGERLLWELAAGRPAACPPGLERAGSLTAVVSSRGETAHAVSRDLVLDAMQSHGLRGVFSLSDPESDLYLFDSGGAGFRHALEAFCRELYRVSGSRFAAGVPAAADRLPESFASARRTRESLFFTGEPLLWPEDVLPQTWRFQRDLLTDFSEDLRAGKKEACVQFINRLTEDLSKCQRTPVREVKEFYFRMLVCILEEQQRLGASREARAEGDRYHWETVFLIPSLFVLKNYVMENLEDCFETLGGLDAAQSRYQQILTCIEENYRTPSFGLAELGALTYMSVPYLCTVFKSRSGKTVNSYITGRRMAEARRLLAQPDVTIAQIAQRVGFSDQNYFSKRFTKLYGVSPSKYREQLAAGGGDHP